MAWERIQRAVPWVGGYTICFLRLVKLGCLAAAQIGGSSTTRDLHTAGFWGFWVDGHHGQVSAVKVMLLRAAPLTRFVLYQRWATLQLFVDMHFALAEDKVPRVHHLIWASRSRSDSLSI